MEYRLMPRPGGDYHGYDNWMDGDVGVEWLMNADKHAKCRTDYGCARAHMLIVAVDDSTMEGSKTA